MSRKKLPIEERSQDAIKLLEYRKKHNYTQAVLASLARINKQTIANIELGTISKNHGISLEIALALNKIGLNVKPTGKSGKTIKYYESYPNFNSSPRLQSIINQK